MESLVDLLPLLFVGLYYLLASRRRARVRKEASERVEAPQSDLVHEGEREPTPFQSFLEQLEETMAEAEEIEETDRAIVPDPPPRAESVPAAPHPQPTLGASSFRAVEGSFVSAEPVDHEAHGFGSTNPLSEETLESLPTYARRDAGPKPSYDPHGLHARRPLPSGGPDWRRRLRDPRAAREAFVLQTIFGPRGGIRGDRRSGGRR